ncbi:hypothetical protein KSC_103160 [Ktedonobacter sp. SOSP1-52]|uniref:Tc toxin subunit A-related protein n=1 Tax=Ktedonobacter sp. SOSP1-52 TaxID=2778366 RepID=UPI0019151D50|nr:hypothetical protein [Ktedonobacter sp. SOSP1-52]GHO71424.1 hypothetical protein KSC_103160 [Ktedonobacter sp. SOSP1-52]
MANSKINAGFHDMLVADLKSGISRIHIDTQFTYTFENFFHPFVGELLAKLNRDSLPGMLDATWQDGLKQDFFNALYNPTENKLVQVRSFPKEIDVSEHGPYASYNWELFFHIPLTIAVHLSKTQRFAEAQRWFHYIFDPTSNDHSVDPPLRFWKFLAFRQAGGSKRIEDIVRLLSIPRSELSHDDQLFQDDIMNGYDAIRDKPFQPHAVARTRHLAYQYCVVMKYLDNLIAWGDNLFQQDTVESINEATQLYVLAANILGERPQQIPPPGKTAIRTFAQLKKELGPIGDALVDLEGQFPFNLAAPNSSADGSDAGDSNALFGIGRTLYFCIPRNDKLLGYWDTVSDRLFKIRHCMNIAGVVRPLALFDPPIDPGMLVKAAAAGIDIGSIVSGANQPIGPLRCLILIQKALELCGEVRNLGNALLSALEKGDAEHLALVRQRHEVQIQQMAQGVRFLQWKQAQEATEALRHSRATALERYNYYQRLLGFSEDNTDVPDELPIDRRELTEDNFDEAYAALVDQYTRAVPVQDYPNIIRAPELVSDLIAFQLPAGNLYLNLYEFLDLNVLGPAALVLRSLASATNTTTSVLAEVPDAFIDGLPLGVGGHAAVGGGSEFANSGQSVSRALDELAHISEFAASYASKAAGYQRRAGEWILQYNLAARELMQIGRQILTSLIAEQIAHHEYQSIQQQIANAQEVDQFLHDKFTNEDLYLWMQGEISRLYYEYYRFAFDTARKAERTMKQELMRPEVDIQDFVKFNYWDSGRKGLLSGEALYLDVKRMEMAYLDNNKRELELTRHVSLRQLDPLALITFRSTGTCQVTIPEWLYDRDYPGHYMRRIKSAALSLPSVVGPYTSVNCTLSLLKSSLRKSPLLKDGEYVRQGTEDDRFVDYTGTLQSIATSSANNDSGLFETNLRDERFLPFEGAGAESTWKLDLPVNYPAFDYSTISDVILHIRYTARQGIDPTKVKGALDSLFRQTSPSNLGLLFNLRYDFSTEWSAFVNGTANFTTVIRRDYFPYLTQGQPITITGFDLYGQDMTKHPNVGDPAGATTDLGNHAQFTLSLEVDNPPGLHPVLTRTASAQVFLIVRYALGV